MVLIIGKTISLFHTVTVNGRLSHEVLAIKEWKRNREKLSVMVQ